MPNCTEVKGKLSNIDPAFIQKCGILFIMRFFCIKKYALKPYLSPLLKKKKLVLVITAFFGTSLNCVPQASVSLTSPSSQPCVLFLEVSGEGMDIYFIIINYSFLLLFNRSVMSDSLRPRGLQHARLPCPSPSPGACSNSCPLSQ